MIRPRLTRCPPALLALLVPGLRVVETDLVLEEGPVRELGTYRRQRQVDWAREHDVIAEDLAALGPRVTRLPVLHSEEGDLLTWSNAVLDRRGDEAAAYVPSYGVPLLDRRAHDVWRRPGFRVVAIDIEEPRPLGSIAVPR